MTIDKNLVAEMIRSALVENVGRYAKTDAEFQQLTGGTRANVAIVLNAYLMLIDKFDDVDFTVRCGFTADRKLNLQ